MGETLLFLVTLSVGGGAAVAALAFFSRSTRSRYGARWRCWAWLLLCLRLAVPIPLLPQAEEGAKAPIQLTAPSDVIVYQRPARPQSGESTSGSPSREEGGAQASSPAQSVGDGQSGAPSLPSAGSSGQGGTAGGLRSETSSSGLTLSLSQVVGAVWLAGVAGVLIWALISHLRFLLYLRRWGSPVVNPATIQLFNQLGNQLHLDRRPRLMTCQGLRVPMLAGLVRPTLLLPEFVPSEDALRYSMLHELTHFRRRDIWLKTLSLAACALHWFNPLMWYMTRLVERDTELACDEAALRALPAGEHRAYGQTILDAVAQLKGS